MQLKRISISKVLKLELPVLINEVIRIVEKYNPKYMGLQTFHNFLLESQQQMKLLKMRAAAHPLTKRVQALREKECKCAGAIFLHMQSAERVDIVKLRSSVTIAMPTVSRFLAGLRKNNESVINETIHQFLEHLDEHPEVYDALSVLGLHYFVDEMRSVNKQKMDLMAKRDANNAKRKPEADSKAIQKKAYYNLNYLFDVIELYDDDSDMPSYDALIGELNILLTRYATIINMRKAHNMRKSVRQSPHEEIGAEDN